MRASSTSAKGGNVALLDWFLSGPKRANPVSGLPVWTSGNLAEPLIHGAAYFDREHLDRDPAGGDDADLVDPDDAITAITGAAQALQRWHDGGQVGPRPPGRLRSHRSRRLPWWIRAWALPAYRLVYDPDGRPLRARRAGTW
ncbi:hypothetical protein [Micromonospora tarapacensis]|uniref:hypothetical protein n=1 Tax=Micromonospora tarapacensis TaxID=2835305 RepID=UPI001E450651|nr:hypothetical protein [Micromonospora tarapacensis]